MKEKKFAEVEVKQKKESEKRESVLGNIPTTVSTNFGHIRDNSIGRATVIPKADSPDSANNTTNSTQSNKTTFVIKNTNKLYAYKNRDSIDSTPNRDDS